MEQKNGNRFVEAGRGNAFLLTEEGAAHAPAGKEGEYASGYPIRGFEHRMERSFIERGWVIEGKDPDIEWGSDKQIKYARHIAEVTGTPLPNVLSRGATHRYISENQEKAEQFEKDRKMSQAERIADALGIDRAEIGGAEGAAAFTREHLKDYRQWERSEIVGRVPINEYAESLGYEIEKVGQKWHTIKGMDSIRITGGDGPNGVWVRNSQTNNEGGHVGGSVIDFAMVFKNLTYTEALDELRNYAGGLEGPDIAKISIPARNEHRAEQRELRLSDHPEAQNMKNVFAYLIKTRNIEPAVVSDMAHRKMLYQDTHANCVFVSYDDGKPTFACLRGTNTDPQKKFVADVSGCDYSKGWHVKNGSDKLIVCEAPIDAMSIMSAFSRSGIDYKGYDYLAISGVSKLESLSGRLKGGGMREVYLAFDNDRAGRNAVVEGGKVALAASPDIKVVESLPQGKDWNSELVAAGKNGWIDTSSFTGGRIQQQAAQKNEMGQGAQKNQQRQRQQFGLSM